jgi:tetratricopeptide (TPR) repeat protein
VVFLKLNAEKGEGKELAEEYQVRGFPTFIVTNAKGEQIDRWWGYDDPASFVAELDEARADPTTVEEKIARFGSQPTEKDAAALGRIFTTRQETIEAVRYLREAQRLADDGGPEYAADLFGNIVRGYADEHFTLEDVQQAADAVVGQKDPAVSDLLSVAYRMADLAKQESDPTLLEPYAGPALAAYDANPDEDLAGLSREVRIARALVVDADPEAAVALKRESLPEHWQEDAEQLNAFAWWCFENVVNLEEAEVLARRGVELSEPGTERAMILDTVAEICNARGKCDEAVDLMARAVEEDPDNEHYQEQLERFEVRVSSGCA